MAYTLDWAEIGGCLEECANAKAYLERMYARPRAGLRIAAGLQQVGMG
jgi:glutathione S-transferase